MKHVVTILFCFCLLPLFSQTEAGRYIVGGSADISASYADANYGHPSHGFNLSLAPTFGVFVYKGLVVAGRYTFGVSSSKTYDKSNQRYNTSTTFTSSIGPLLKYYIGNKPVKGVVSATAAYVTSVTLKSPGGVSGTDGFNATGLAGMAYFLNPHISLETGLYITASGYKKQYPTTRIGISFGFFAFLDKKKKE